MVCHCIYIQVKNIDPSCETVRLLRSGVVQPADSARCCQSFSLLFVEGKTVFLKLSFRTANTGVRQKYILS